MVYLAIFQKNIRLQLQYRSELLLSILSSIIAIYVQIVIWRTLLTDNPEASPISLDGMITYIMVFFIIRKASATNFFSTMETKVNRGDIAIDLIKPINLKNSLISEQLSENISKIIFSILPVVVLAGFVWGFEIFVGPLQFLVFIISAVLAIALTFYIQYAFSLLIFWTRDKVYPRQITSGLLLIFSGSAVPLWFYPEWMQILGRFLPFRMMGFETIQIYMGILDINQSIRIIIQQLLWLGGLWILERFIWSRIKNNVFVQGG